MARYLGPIHKKSRRLKFSILENNKDFVPNKTVKRRKMQKRKTDFGLQLEEKQKLRYRYNLAEKQLRNIFVKVLKLKGDQNKNLLLAMELRLDNFVFRSGLAKTRREARQLVSHNHILLNNKKANIPSIQLKIGDFISLKKEKMKKKETFVEKMKSREKLSYIEVDQKNFVAKLKTQPDVDKLINDINFGLIIEYYNRFI